MSLSALKPSSKFQIDLSNKDSIDWTGSAAEMLTVKAREEKSLDDSSIDETHLVVSDENNVMEDTNPGHETDSSRKYELSTKSRSVITSGKETKVSTLDEISVDEYHLVDGDNVMEDTDPRDETELYSKYESSTKSRSETITLDEVGARHGDASQVNMDCVQGSFVTTAWTNDSKTRDIQGVVGENNIEDVHEALEEICFNLKTRKK